MNVGNELSHQKELFNLALANVKELILGRLDQEKETRENWTKANERQVEEARLRISERLAGMNELRDQITQERGTYISRESHEKDVQGMDARIKGLELRESRLTGSIWALGAFLSGVVVLVNLLIKYWH